jgi:hypothetical protein
MSSGLSPSPLTPSPPPPDLAQTAPPSPPSTTPRARSPTVLELCITTSPSRLSIERCHSSTPTPRSFSDANATPARLERLSPHAPQHRAMLHACCRRGAGPTLGLGRRGARLGPMSRGGPNKFVASAIMRVCSLCEERKVPCTWLRLRLQRQWRPTWLRPFCPSYSTTASSCTLASQPTSPCTDIPELRAACRITNDLILDKGISRIDFGWGQVDAVARPSDCSVQQLGA